MIEELTSFEIKKIFGDDLKPTTYKLLYDLILDLQKQFNKLGIDNETFKAQLKIIISDKVKLELESLIETGQLQTMISNELNKLTSNINEISYNFLQYGGKRNSDFNNTPILQELVNNISTNGGGTIYIPKGVYNFERNGSTDYCIIWKSNVSLKGAGIGKTILKTGKNTDTSLYSLFYNLDKANLLTNCNFSNFTVDLSEMGSNSINYTHKGKVFYFQGVEHGIYEKFELIGAPSTALGIDFCNNVFIDKVICTNCGRLWVENYKNSAGNYIEGPGGAGIGIGTGFLENEHVSVTNCICDNCGHYGIFFEHQGMFDNTTYSKISKGVIIDNNIVKNGRGYGIGVRGGNSYNITNNIIYDNKWDGINLNSGEYSTTLETLTLKNIIVKNNNCHNNRDGIAIDGRCRCYGIDIKENYCSSNTINGISIGYRNATDSSKERVLVKNNRVEKNKNAIFYKSFPNYKDIIIKNNEYIENENNCGKLKIGNKGYLKMSKELFDNNLDTLILKIKIPTHSDKICLMSNRDENYNTNGLIKGYSISIDENNKLFIQTCSENNGTSKSFISNEIIDITNPFYLRISKSSANYTFSFSYDATDYTNFTFNDDLSSNFHTAFSNQPNDEITLFREWSGSYGFGKYGKDVVFYKLISINNIDNDHIFEVTDNVTKQLNDDLYYLKTFRNAELYLDYE